MSDIKKRVAVITGASSGLGRDYAKQLAAEGYGLMLVARNREKLDQLAEQLRSEHKVDVDIEVVDLADIDQTRRLAEKIAKLENLEFMINNAGFGFGKRFPQVDIEIETSMIRVHCEATVRLSHAAAIAMTPHQKGYIINVASMAAFLTGPGAADYCATKGFVNSFSNSIQDDLRSAGIRVQSLCPGYVRTGFHDAPTMRDCDMSAIPGCLWLKSERVVRDSLRKVRNGSRVTYIPSLRYKIAYCFMTFPFVSTILKCLLGGKLKR